MKLIIFLLFVSRVLSKRLVCYTTNWSQYRPTEGKFFPENIDPHLCTHLIYAFAVIKDGLLASYEWNDESTSWSKGLYEKTTDLKQVNPNLKVLLAVGGWNFGSTEFSRLVSNPESIKRFVKHSVEFLKKFKFDGLDLDWEYPSNREGSNPEDKANFSKLVQELKSAYSSDNLLLTAAVAAGKSVIDSAYEINNIINGLDFLNVMTYDYHGAWEKETGHHTPYYSRPEETGEMKYFNVKFTIEYYLSKGVPRDKINLGFATYGRSFKLRDASVNGIGAPVSGPGSAEKYTRQDGFAGNFEICQKMSQGWTKKWSDVQKVPYAFYNNEWIGFDDEQSYQIKIDFLNELDLGGAMVWALDMDDFTGKFCQQGKYPVINFIKSRLSGGSPTTTRSTATSQSTSNTISTTTMTTTTTGSRTCPNGAGYYADKSTGCQNFYICTQNSNNGYEIHLFNCPPGLLFDEKLKVCNYASQVVC